MPKPPRTLTGMIPAGAKPRRAVGPGAPIRYFVRGRALLSVYLHDDDPCFPQAATSFDRKGRMHGLEREWHDDGRLKYEARWDHGLQHGWQRQWDRRGRLIVRTRFVRGTGNDIYCGNPYRGVTETREMVDGLRDGFERWWRGATRVWAERRFAKGLEHGVFRDWNDGDRLRRGFPKYYVRGEQVDRRAYLRACDTDPTLPRPSARDDRPTRPSPRAKV